MKARTFTVSRHTGRRVREVEVELVGPDKDLDPVRWYQSQTRLCCKNYAMICMAGFMGEGNNNFTITTHFDANGDLSEENIQNFEALGSKLNTFIVKEDTGGDLEEWSSPILDSSDLYSQASKDNSTLMRFLSTLATGTLWSTVHFDFKDDAPTENEEEVSMQSSYSQSRYIAVYYICRQLLGRIKNSNKPWPFQVAMGNFLEAHAAPNNMMRFLSSCRLSASISSVSSKNMDKIAGTLQAGLDFAKMKGELLLLAFNNLGFRSCGASAGYQQYTMLMLRFLTAEKLREHGIDQADQQNGKKWKDVAATTNVHATFQPTVESNNVLSERSIAAVRKILEMAPGLPTVEEARDILDTNKLRTQAVVFGVGVPADYGIRCKVSSQPPPGSVVVATDVAREKIEEGGEEKPKLTSYEINNQTIEIQWTVDLAKKKTLVLLRDYGKLLMEKAKKAAGDEWDGSIMKDYGIASLCDGQPAYGFASMRDENPELFDNFHCFFGDFHLYLETHKKKDSILADAHARDCYWTWRPSDKSSDFVLFPSDPMQTALERTESHCTTLYTAALMTAEAKETEEVSAVEVVDNMLKRAGEQPEAFSALIDVRLSDLLWMIRDSEKTGEKGCNPNLYRAALRYAAALFSTTGAFKYVRILADLAISFHCSSDMATAV